MADQVRVGELLSQARDLFDLPESGLAHSAAGAWKTGFASGGQWMRQGLDYLRGVASVELSGRLNALGLCKYGLASGGALLCVVGAWLLREPLVLLLCVPVFYAIEAQMVFLFPVVFDGSDRPFRDSRQWTVYAGGTLAVMRVVLPIAATMLFGGFCCRGFVRSWCIGCLAVCIWYEKIRTVCQPCVATPAARS